MAVLFIITSASSVADADKQVRVDDLVYDLYADGTAEVTDYVGDGGDIIIPDYLEWSGKNYSIVSVGAWAFSHCYEITSMHIGNNVVMIGDYAFHNCFRMVSVTIPQSVQFIGESAFGATRLTDINLSSSNQFFKVVDGVLFGEDGSRLLVYPGMKADPIYHVPSGVRVIDEEAFCNNFELKELYINEGIVELLSPIGHCSIEVLGLPSTLESIPDILIRGAPHLSTILLSEDNDHFILYDGMLCDRSLERVVTIPAGVDYENLAIPEGVKELERCSGGYVVANIVSLPSTLEWIGFCAFESSEINNVVIPESVRTIDNCAFSRSELKAVTFLGVPREICLGAFTVSSDVLIECYADEPVPLEEYVSSGTVVEYYSLDSGYGWAFSVVIDGLTYDLYPDGVAELVGYGMNEITVPESVTYEGRTYTVSSIKSGLFKHSDIVSIAIPGSVKNVDWGMFWHCSDLESVVLGEGIEYIGADAFKCCYSLTSFTLPSTLRSMGEQPFSDCGSLKTLKISESNQFFKTVNDVLFSKDGSILYCYPGGKGDVSYNLPDTVRMIGRDAISDNNYLESLTLNEGLVSMGECSIIRCWNLEYVNIPSTVYELEEPFIRFCPNIVEIDVSEDNPWYVSVDEVMFTYDMTTLLKYPSGIQNAHYDVPEGVRELAYSSMEYAELNSVSFPSTLESIGNFAFQASWLEQLSIPSSIRFIGDGAFNVLSHTITEYYASEKVPLEDYCHGQTILYVEVTPGSIPVGTVFTVGDMTYRVCFDGSAYAEVKEYHGEGGYVEIPDDVEHEGMSIPVFGIGDYAFRNSDITDIRLPLGLRTIGDYAFSQCHGLYGTLVIPDSVEHIGVEAFYNTWYTDVVIGKGLRSLGDGAFATCGDMWEYHIGSGFTVNPENIYFTTTTEPHTPGLLISKDGRTLYSALKCMTGKLIIPPSVEIIAPGAFEWCDGFKGTIVIPESVRDIGARAFSNVGGTGFVVESGNQFYKAVDGLLLTYDGRELLSCPAHYGGQVIIPDGVEMILEGAFYNNTSVSGTLAIPSSVKFVYDVAFYGANFKEIVFSEGLERIGYFAFYLGWVADQKELIIPESVVAIGAYAFQSIGITDLLILGSPELYYGAFAHNPIETISFSEPVDDISEAFIDLNLSGYTFNGFYEDEDYEVPVDLADGVSTSDTTFYVSWLVKSCTISYELDGGLNSPLNPVVYDVMMGDVLLQPAVREGYTFSGWYFIFQENEFEVDCITSDHFDIPDYSTTLVLHARWTPIQLMISFSSDVPCDLPTPMEVSFGDTVILPTIISDDGRGLRGWSDGVMMYAPGSTVTVGFTQDTVLEAVWSDAGLIAMLAVSDGNAYCSVVSLDGSPIQAGTRVDITFTVLRVSTFMGFQIYKPIAVTETLTVDSDGGSLCIGTYDLDDILGSDHAVISMVAMMDGQSFGFMTLDHRGEV